MSPPLKGLIEARAMTDYPVKLPLKRSPTHPGILMREIIEEQVKLSKAEAARRMRISRPSLYAVLNGEGDVSRHGAALLPPCRRRVATLSQHAGGLRPLARATAPYPVFKASGRSGLTMEQSVGVRYS